MKTNQLGVLGYIIKDGPAADAPPVNDPAAIFAQLQDIKDMDREHFVCFYLDTRSRIIKRDTVSVGTLSASLVHPREVFKGAIIHNAATVILAHNHPSGDITPSPEDRQATRRLVDAGRLLGIAVMDHVIVGARTDSYFSFKQGD